VQRAAPPPPPPFPCPVGDLSMRADRSDYQRAGGRIRTRLADMDGPASVSRSRDSRRRSSRSTSSSCERQNVEAQKIIAMISPAANRARPSTRFATRLSRPTGGRGPARI